MDVTDRDREIAITILEQLGGGSMLRRLLGPISTVAMKRGVSIRGIDASDIGRVDIVLTPYDVYEVRAFRRGAALDAEPVSVVDEVYVDVLHDVLERATGLTWRMPRIAFGAGYSHPSMG